MKDAGPIFAFFRRVPKKRMSAHKMYNIGFLQMNPLPMRVIEAKRRFHRPILQVSKIYYMQTTAWWLDSLIVQRNDELILENSIG